MEMKNAFDGHTRLVMAEENNFCAREHIDRILK